MSRGVLCAPQPKKATAGDTLYRPLGGDPAMLDPIVTAEELGPRVEALIFRPLAMAWPRAEAARRLYSPDGASLLAGLSPAGAPENSPELPGPLGWRPAATPE